VNASKPRPTKHREISRALESEIRSGRWEPGGRLPSEAELVRRFGASRITVGRAVRDLQLAGLVERRVGSGTYVRPVEQRDGAHSFGLLIPDLGETEIFEPLCQGMMSSPLAREHALVWGSDGGATASGEDRAWDLCRQLVERKVSGVFFAPLEHSAKRDEVNARIVRALDEAGLPVVLLDRPVGPYPHRGHHDLVAVDHREAGYCITEHLLSLGARRLVFVGLPEAASTVDMRVAGYREALHARGLPCEGRSVHRLDPADTAAVRALMEGSRPEGIVAANDRTAGRLMHTLIGLGYSVPDDVRLVGIDDVDYASLLPVPLTTLRQPTREIGAADLAAMLDRMGNAELPTRDILLHGTLIVRRSSG